MASLRGRAEKAGLDILAIMEKALKVTEAYASSGAQYSTKDSIVDLYEKMIIAQIEVFEEGNK